MEAKSNKGEHKSLLPKLHSEVFLQYVLILLKTVWAYFINYYDNIVYWDSISQDSTQNVLFMYFNMHLLAKQNIPNKWS